MAEIVSVVSLPMKDGYKDAPEWKDQDAYLATPGLVASFRGSSPDDPNRLELASIWASEADHDAFRATEPANKLRAALESRVDEGKAAAEPGARYAGVIVNQAASAAGSFAAVAAAPLVHVGSYRVPASVAPADFEKAWEALCAKAGGPPPGAVAGPTHGWGKEPAPDGSGDRIFVVTGGWESREKYDAVAADPGHPAALPLMGLATRAQSKFAVFEKLK